MSTVVRFTFHECKLTDSFLSGILQVSAEEKSSGKNRKIEIQNNKGRLSQKEIERMIHEAEQYREDDEKARDRVHSRNQLESYIYSCRQVVESESGDSLSNSEKSNVIKACDQCEHWLMKNQSADKRQFDDQYRELEKKCQKIFTKLHTKQNHDSRRSGPRIEEAD